MKNFTSQIVDFLEYKDGDPGTICWLNCSTLIHTGSQQQSSIVVRALEKRGSGIEKIEYGIGDFSSLRSTVHPGCGYPNPGGIPSSFGASLCMRWLCGNGGGA